MPPKGTAHFSVSSQAISPQAFSSQVVSSSAVLKSLLVRGSCAWLPVVSPDTSQHV